MSTTGSAPSLPVFRQPSESSDTSELSTSSAADSEAPCIPSKPRATCQPSVIPETTYKRSACVHALTIVILIVAIGTSIASLTFSLVLYRQLSVRQQAESSALPSPICLPCQDLVRTPYPLQEPNIHVLDIHVKNLTMICCASTSRQLGLFVEKLVQRKISEQQVRDSQEKQLEEEFASVRQTTRTVGAHLLVGYNNGNKSGDSDQVHGWILDGMSTYLRGLRIVDDRIVIEHSGLYLIYSQIYYKVKHNATEHPHILLSHRILRYSLTIPNDGKEELLQTIQSCCGNLNQNLQEIYFYTSSVVGVFKLNTRDELYATVSNMNYIYRDPRRSFIGLYKL